MAIFYSDKSDVDCFTLLNKINNKYIKDLIFKNAKQL